MNGLQDQDFIVNTDVSTEEILDIRLEIQAGILNIKKVRIEIVSGYIIGVLL